MLWEHEVAGSIPATPTTSLVGGYTPAVWV